MKNCTYENVTEGETNQQAKMGYRSNDSIVATYIAMTKRRMNAWVVDCAIRGIRKRVFERLQRMVLSIDCSIGVARRVVIIIPGRELRAGEVLIQIRWRCRVHFKREYR